ncbi:unnamed protein product [Zymoseptoria tritici ST99CH_3D1]|nr:unnamed protein product [Zymoseptoria tritici ST99CH_3D1]SMR62727.1 unnamed protein product [Zymoseptoria tritici ST99CH_3D1]
MAKVRAVSISCSEQVLSAGPMDERSDGHVRFKFAPHSASKQHDPPTSLKKEPEGVRKHLPDQLHLCHSPDHKADQIEKDITTLANDLHPPTPYKMDLGPDIYEDAQAESSSAALARQQPQTRPDRSQTVTTAASFTTAPETPPIPHTADSSNDVTHANPVYKSNPTTQVCELHEFCYSSQYTRPVVEMLTEVLEVRYPSPATTPSGAVRGRDDEERIPLLAGEDGSGSRHGRDEGSCCWIHKLWSMVRSA